MSYPERMCLAHSLLFIYSLMKIKIIVVGKTDSRALDTLIGEYLKRVQPFQNVELIVLSDVKKSKKMSAQEQKKKEGKLIREKLDSKDYVILLDEKGKEYTSMEFSRYLSGFLMQGVKTLVFIIGGPYGFSQEIYDLAQSKCSLSRMTFSHQMVRLFFVEQLYRAFTIIGNKNYHHE